MVAPITSLPPTRSTRRSSVKSRVILAFCALFSVSGCTSWNPLDWFGEEESTSPYAGQEPPGQNESYPDLRSVPERPAKGLVADIRDRLYEEDGKGKKDRKKETDKQTNTSATSHSASEPGSAPTQSVTIDRVEPPPAEPLADLEPAPPDTTMIEETMMEETVGEPEEPEILAISETFERQPPRGPRPDQPQISIKMETLHFSSGSYFIPPDDRRYIQEIVSVAEKKQAFLRVIGYASSFTRDMPLLDHQMTNFSVSLNRAQAVANVILAAGFDKDRLFIDARSDSDPVFLEVMPAGRQGNQRAEIYLEY